MSALGFDAALWPRLSALLDQALERPQGDRAAWLERLDEPDADTLRPLLRRLLAEDSGPEPTLPGLDDSSPHRPNDSIGPYRLVHPLGRGGMGSVWLARRADGVLQRPVALKLPHSSGPGLVERMAREREMLAALSHPNIAQLYDAGISADGQPYLALEVVSGAPIDRWCADHALTIAQRLTLFLQAARAVAHAHAKLIVHRDLKPSNLLVDEQGQVKLLDFGIAKLLAGPGADETTLTREGARPMSPAYAAPEQVAGQDVDTRADVYGLGMVLFELLTGQRPYRLLRSTAAALEEAILQQVPPRPSEVVSDRAQSRALRGDLDTLVAKALKKAPVERYATVEALAEDIERYLSHRPLLARPDSPAYVLRRLVRRHRLGFGAAAVAACGLLAGAGVATWQAHRAELERQRATAVNQFVTALLRDASPYRPTAAGWRTSRFMARLIGMQSTDADVTQVTALDLLRHAGDQLAAGGLAHPEARSELLRVVAEGLAAFGDGAQAERMAQRALDDARQHLGDEHPQTLRTRLAQAQLKVTRGQPERARLEIEALLPALRQQARAQPETLLLGLQLFAVQALDDGSLAEAAAAVDEAAALLARLPPQHPERVAMATLVSRVQRARGQAEAARDAASQALALSLQLHGTTPQAGRVEARVALGRALADLGELAASVREYETAVDETRRLLGNQSPVVSFLMKTIVPLDLALGDIVRADQRSQEALRIATLHMKPGTYAHDGAAAARAAALLARDQPGDADAALQLVDAALPTFERLFGRRHEQTVGVRLIQLRAWLRLGRQAEARQALPDLQRAATALDARVTAMRGRAPRSPLGAQVAALGAQLEAAR